MGHLPDPVPRFDCPHYDLGPPDDDGVQICKECGQLVVQVIASVPVNEFVARISTVRAEEGADVHLPESDG